MKFKRITTRFAILLFILFANNGQAQPTDKKLQRQLIATIQGFKGDMGFYILNVKNGKVAQYNADTIFPTASIVKVPILIGIMDKMDKQELNYHQPLIYKDSLLYEGEDILGSFKNNEKIELSKVMMLMLTTSDNTASLWLQSLAGTGFRINQLLDSLGLKNTKVNSRTPGREMNRSQYGWGQTTPKEMAHLMLMMTNKKIINDAASDKMLKLMSRNYLDEEALSAIPAGVFVASKSGAVNASRNEILFVNGKQTPYIFSVFTKNNIDQSWGSTNEAWELTRKLSAIVWKHFNE